MIDILFSIPVTLKVFLTLCFFLLFHKLLKNLLLSLALGTAIIAFWSGHSPVAAAEIAWMRFSSIDNFFLMVIILQVIFLSSQMGNTGTLKQLVSAVRSRFTRRITIAALPASIGLLPMPGGAVFSAPLVDEADREGETEGSLKTKINYWFRHVWEYWWPLYPGVFLTVDLSGIPLGRFVIIMIPLTAFAILSGYIFFLRRIQPRPKEKSSEGESLFLPFIPIVIVIGVYIILKTLLPALTEINKYLPMVIGLFAAIVYLQIRRPLSRRKLFKMLFSRKALEMALIVAVIRIYGAFIEARLPGGMLLMETMRNELHAVGIPLLLLIVVLPFISGISTGISVGFVGASFPIVLNLLGPQAGTPAYVAGVMLAYLYGFMGIILSPVHVCLIVTNRHFQTSLSQSLIRLLPASLLVLFLGTAYYALLRVLLPMLL